MSDLEHQHDEPTEDEYLQRYASERNQYPRAEHTVDIALFTIRDGQLSILLVHRRQHPQKGWWALPGGFADLGDGNCGEGETLEDAALRELSEETGLQVFPGHLEQLRTYSDPWRDKRGRVISTAYVALMPNVSTPRVGDDAESAHFFAVADLAGEDWPDLAFDHTQIIEDAIARVRSKIEYEGRLAASFLTPPFTIPELRRVYEAVWGWPVRRGDFRRKVLSAQDFLVPTGEQDTATGGPPAALYRLGHATELHPPMLRESMLLVKGEEDGDA